MDELNKLQELNEVEAYRLNRFVVKNFYTITSSELLLEALIDKYVRIGIPPMYQLEPWVEARPILKLKTFVSLSKRTPPDFREYLDQENHIKIELLDFLERKWDHFCI